MAGNNIVNVIVSRIQAGLPNNLQQSGLIVTQGGTTTPAGTLTSISTQASLSAVLSTGTPADDLQAKYNTFSANNPKNRIVKVLELGGGATSAYLYGGEIPAADSLASAWQGITDGSMNITVDSTSIDLLDLDFSACYTMADVAVIVESGMMGLATVAWTGKQFVVSSFSDGSTSTITAASTVAGIGTDISEKACLTSSLASAPVPGFDTGTSAGIAALSLFIKSSLLTYYAVLLPDGWDSDATLRGLVNQYSGDQQMIYFLFTARKATYGVYSGIKSAVMMIQASTAPATESTIAAFFAQIINREPSQTNQMVNFCFNYLYGVTKYPINQADATDFKAGGLNYVDTGAEGGISNTLLKWGVTGDLRDMAYWYAVDWCQINYKRALANAIINGANNTVNPLKYNQDGINRLKQVADGVGNSGIAYGLLLQQSVNAIKFADYNVINPAHYAMGRYDGLSAVVVTSNGFVELNFALNVTDFVQ